MATGGVKEGKTMEGSAIICDACEMNTPVKYCGKCVMHLCTVCAKAHQKITSTKDHVLKALESAAPQTVQGFGTCPKHRKQNLTFACQTCLTLLCLTCKTEHPQHALSKISDDPSIYETICNKQIRNLFDELRELEDIKLKLEEQVDSYDQAIVAVDKLELEVIDRVQKKAAELRKIIKELKDQRMLRITDKVNGLAVKLQAADSKVTELSAIRKSKNYHSLSPKIAAAGTLIGELDTYKLALKPLTNSLRLNDIIPNASQMSIIEEDLDHIFHEGGNHVAPPYESTVIIGKFDIVNPVTRKGYRICKSDNDKKIIIHGYGSDDIRILDTENRRISERRIFVDLNEIVATGEEEYIARTPVKYSRNTQYSLELFTKNFTESRTIEKFGSNSAVIFIKPHSFMLLETISDPEDFEFYEFIFKTMSAVGKKIKMEAVMKLELDELARYPAIHKDHKHVTLCSSTSLYRINLRTGKFTRHGGLEKINAGIKCCLVDSEDNTLLGNSSGLIHLIDFDYNHKVILDVGGVVHDMMISRGRLIVAVTNSKKQKQEILICA